MSRLGGNLGATNIDLPLLVFFRDQLKVKTMLDVGCGKGGMVFHALHLGIQAIGIEGDKSSIPIDCPLIENVDYRKGSSTVTSEFDVGYSCEFLEHVPEEFMPNCMNDFKKCKTLLITAAPPGWGGVGHVNERDESYWISRFKEYGFNYNLKITNTIRSLSSITFDGHVRMPKKQFIKNRGLFFVRA